MTEFDQLAGLLQPHYSHFNVSNRLLFTGHSHQAWPDVAFDGVRQYLQMVADKVDNKWPLAFEKTELLRSYLRNFYDDPTGRYCRGQNTHQLLVAWLSSLDLKNRPKIITTSGEFHSMYRQLRRLQEEGLEIVYLPHHSDDELLHKLRDTLDKQTAAVMLSRIYFETAAVNTKLPDIAALTKSAEIPLLIDDYHGTNVIPLSLQEDGLEHCYLLAGGYKYLQWGEANCFLRYPEECTLRPVITGWFSTFETLDEPRDDKPVSFDDGDQKFASGTYDPISQFRAAPVVDFFRTMGLTPGVLQDQYSSQVRYLRYLFDEQDFDPALIKHAGDRPISQTGGFLALHSPHARKIREDLMKQGVFTDARGDIIRFGPAPYTTSEQCRMAIHELSNVIDSL